MSKYLGKLLLETGSVNRQCLDTVLVKYVNSKDAFCFRFSTEVKVGTGYGGIFYIGRKLCYAIAEMTGTLECQYRWSVGYAVREKKGVESLREMRDAELEMLGSRRELIVSGQLDNDEDFDLLCAIQYLYKFSTSFLDKAMKQVKRKKWGRSEDLWLELERRVLGHGGRKAGCKNKVGSDGNDEKEPLSEILFRIAHNKKVAVSKGFFEWYLEACREECRVLEMNLDKKKCREEFDKLRRECE